MIEFEEALKIITDHAIVLNIEEVVLLDAGSRYLSEAIKAPWPLPRFDNSAMDGFAVRARELNSASESNPIILRVAGESAAGSPFDGAVREGECVKISTGAKLPEELDAAVPREIVTINSEQASFSREVQPNQFIRKLGSDVAVNSEIAGKGDRISPSLTMLLASFNLESVQVFTKPKVAILTSGDEIRELGEELGESDIIGSSLYYLRQDLANFGCEARIVGIAKDSKEAFRDLLEESLSWADVVVSTAGVSVGDHDVVGQVLGELEAEIHFWRVRIRPGKPMLFATVAGKPYFGLPGNPVSSACNTEIFIKPFLRRSFGRDTGLLPCFFAPAATNIQPDKGRLFFQYGSWDETRRGVVPLPNQNSGNLTLPAKADLLIVTDSGEKIISEGTLMKIIPLRN